MSAPPERLQLLAGDGRGAAGLTHMRLTSSTLTTGSTVNVLIAKHAANHVVISTAFCLVKRQP